MIFDRIPSTENHHPLHVETKVIHFNHTHTNVFRKNAVITKKKQTHLKYNIWFNSDCFSAMQCRYLPCYFLSHKKTKLSCPYIHGSPTFKLNARTVESFCVSLFESNSLKPGSTTLKSRSCISQTFTYLTETKGLNHRHNTPMMLKQRKTKQYKFLWCVRRYYQNGKLPKKCKYGGNAEMNSKAVCQLF